MAFLGNYVVCTYCVLVCSTIFYHLSKFHTTQNYFENMGTMMADGFMDGLRFVIILGISAR